MRIPLSILLALFLSISSLAQIQRGLVIDVDTQLILIGDQINLTLELRCDKNDKITFPQILDTLVKNVEVVSRDFPDTTYAGGNLQQQIIKQSLVLTSFDSGVYTINPFAATINGDSAFSQSFMIGVFTYPIDSTNAITDIKGNIEVPLTFMDYVEAYWHYAAGLYGIMAIIMLLYYYFKHKKFKPKEEEIEKIPGIPAHELALQRIINLEDKKMWQSGKFKEYHVRLSEIIREYLENRYNILALEQTTEEILADLKPIRMDAEVRQNLKDLFQLMDLVKFAKQQPSSSENESAMVWSKELIQKTKLIEIAEEKS